MQYIERLNYLNYLRKRLQYRTRHVHLLHAIKNYCIEIRKPLTRFTNTSTLSVRFPFGTIYPYAVSQPYCAERNPGKRMNEEMWQ